MEVKSAILETRLNVTTGSITMNSPISEIFRDNRLTSSINAISNQDEAKDIAVTLSVSDYWPKRWNYTDTRLLTALSRKASRLLKKRAKALPKRTDEFGNVIESDFYSDINHAHKVACKLGCEDFVFFDVCFSGVGNGIAFSYTEGDCTIAKGPNANAAHHAYINFRNEND